MKKRGIILILIGCLIVGVTACRGNTEEDTIPQEISYEQRSQQIYDYVLGEFWDIYNTAKKMDNQSQRFVHMALAEGKLLGSAVMIPLTANGGNYTISRQAPNTMSYTLWGNDNEKVHNTIVCTEFISNQHRSEMKTKWNELKGTGEYEQWAKDYLIENGYELKDSYTVSYASDPLTWDILATSEATDSQMIVQTYDGLLEYDMEGFLQPALATDYTVSDDGTIYTFYLREGVSWVDSQGRKVDEVTADDFVAGMQHMMDAMAGLEYLVEGLIVNASEYIYDEISDFSEVGVKAVDKYTLQYTLTEPCDYFTTMLGYSIFAPMSREYFESKGGKFGDDYDAAASDYTYGTDPNSIAYCGPYVVTNATANNTIVFRANAAYWNAENMNIKTYTVLYNNGTEATKAYNDAINYVIDSVGLNAASLELSKKDKTFDNYAYVSTPNATSFMGFYNLNRESFSNYNDNRAVVSNQSKEEADRTHAAMNNVHFRRAITFAFDRASYNSQVVGEELKLVSLRNTFTPGTFVQTDEDVTVSVNGNEVTFPKGTWYGEIVQAQINADGLPVIVFDPNADSGIGSSDGFDGWYHPKEAVKEMQIAVEELKKSHIEVSDENPIQIDMPYFAGSEVYSNRAYAYKQSIENVLSGFVQVNLIVCNDQNEWRYAGFYPENGAQSNYDFCDIAGWGPDYGDPSTYLDTMQPDYAGYMTKCLGIY